VSWRPPDNCLAGGNDASSLMYSFEISKAETNEIEELRDKQEFGVARSLASAAAINSCCVYLVAKELTNRGTNVSEFYVEYRNFTKHKSAIKPLVIALENTLH
jgi:hypothetical protein